MLIAIGAPAFALGGPLLLGLSGFFLARRAPPAATPQWDWRLMFASALLYALAFNLIFFIQELFLVLPKALTPGLRPTLFHNNHTWDGDNPLAQLLQGTGALAIFATAGACAAWLRFWPPRTTALRLFVIWLIFNGVYQSLPQVVVGAVFAGNDVGMAMNYLGLSAATKTAAALASLAAIAAIGIALARPLLELAPDVRATEGPRGRALFLGNVATLPALIALPLIILSRVPGSIDQVVIVPVAVSVIGASWIQASAWFTIAKPSAAAAMHALGMLTGAFLLQLALFHLVLRPGVPFF